VNRLFIPVLVATIENTLLVMFDTIVVAVTLSNTIGTLMQLKQFQLAHAKSLTQVMVEQGN
jgi:hypothetical protein